MHSLNSEACVDYDLQRPFLWYNGEGKNYEHNDRQRQVYMCTQSSNYSPISIPSLLDGKSIASFILYPYQSLIGCSTITGWFGAIEK
jgi:hypothetical protein